MSLLIVLFLAVFCTAEKPRSSLENYESYVDWYKGDPDTNVVLSAPHDGHLKPEEIPDRIRGCYVNKVCDYHHDCTGERVNGSCKPILLSDLHSSHVAIEIRKKIGEVTGKMPHLVVSKLHRSKLDPNRPKDSAAQYNTLAEKVYDTFHGYIQRIHNILAARGPAIHFDIHGYRTHDADNWTELGYNIRKTSLNAGGYKPEESSILSLAHRSALNGIDFESLVSGEASLGKLAEDAGYKTVPSPKYKSPSAGSPGKYFAGGYITRKWGSLWGGEIDCVQIEYAQWLRNDSQIHGPKWGLAIASWVQRHYPDSLYN